MEEDKAAAYYDELTLKGGGAARFKQGLGFSATTDHPPLRGSALPSSTSSFMSNFVKASSPSQSKHLEKQAQLHNIHNKLTKTKNDSYSSSSADKIRVSGSDRRSGSREKERERDPDKIRVRVRDSDSDSDRRRSGSREKDSRRKRRRRSRSRERRRRRRSGDSDEEREGSRRPRYRWSSSRERRRRSRSRSRSLSPRDWRSERKREDGGRGREKERRVVKKEGNGNGIVDYAKLIDGYDNMTAAERVKAKMKLQLSQTAKKDEKMGTGSGWERFDFDKDAPVDDGEIEAGDDDAAVVKRINQSFRFSSLEAKREDVIRSAHDEAMFGAPGPAPSHTSDSENESEKEKKDTKDDDVASSLLNEKVLAKQQGSWRDRARRNVG